MNKKIIYSLIIILFLIPIYFLSFKSPRSIPDGLTEWQAVFLSDGQVYFGKLEEHNKNYFLLSKVYYLKYASDIQQNINGSNYNTEKNLNLIKLGGEAHGPENYMFISKDKIMFIENLSPNSKIVNAINLK